MGNSYLDPDNDATWTFFKHVVKQVTDITGSGSIHIGGDEPHRMNAERPGTHGPFLTRAAQIVRDMGLSPIGWNEWADGTGEIKAGDTIQYWNGNLGHVQNKVNTAGAQVIWSAAGNAYFPQKAGYNVWGPTWAAGTADLSKFYDYDPVARAGVAENTLRGVEGAMWAEHARSIQDFFFPSYPRAMALAEVAWSPQAKRAGKLADLKRRLADTVPALTLLGADFYAEDGLVNKPLVAASDLSCAPSVGVRHTIARGYMPMTDAADVSAKIVWDNGGEAPLEVVQRRPYQAPNANNNNNRAQNGLWELVLAELPGAGTHTGTITFTAGEASATDTVSVHVTGGATVFGNNLALSAASGAQGAAVTATLTDFKPNTQVAVHFGDTELGVVEVDGAGTGTLEFAVPAVRPGTYELTTDPAGANADHVAFTVTAAYTPEVALSRSEVAPNATVGVLVSGLEPGATAQLSLVSDADGEADAARTAVELAVSADGRAAGVVQVPANTRPGTLTVQVTQGWWSGSAALTVADTVLAHPIDQKLYRLAGTSSQETASEQAPATNAFDGDPETFWHTKYGGGADAFPHYLTIDLGATYAVDGLSYLPRQSNANGLVKDYQVFVTAEDPKGIPPAPRGAGQLPDVRQASTRAASIVPLKAVEGRYVTLVATSSLAGNAFAGAAEPQVSGVRGDAPTTDGLIAALTEAQQAPLANKTPASVAALGAACADGAAILVRDDASQQDIDAAAAAIRAAIEGLADVIDPEPGPDPEPQPDPDPNPDPEPQPDPDPVPHPRPDAGYQARPGRAGQRRSLGRQPWGVRQPGRPEARLGFCHRKRQPAPHRRRGAARRAHLGRRGRRGSDCRRTPHEAHAVAHCSPYPHIKQTSGCQASSPGSRFYVRPYVRALGQTLAGGQPALREHPPPHRLPVSAGWTTGAATRWATGDVGKVGNGQHRSHPLCPDTLLQGRRARSPSARIRTGPLLVLGHDALVGRKLGIDLVVQRVQLATANLTELPDGNGRIGRQRHRAHREKHRGVVRGRHRGDAVGELRDRHDEHDPQAQRVRAMLQPGAALDEKRRHRAGDQQRQAAVEAVVGDAVVRVGEVPEIVRQDPAPEHVGPDHVARAVLRDEDAQPPADGDDVQDARDAVHDVPRARDGPQVLDRAAAPQPEAEHLEVADHGLGDVDGQDHRRKQARPALLHQAVAHAVGVGPAHVAQRHEAQTARQRRIGLDPVEPRARAVLVARRGRGGPHEDREHQRRHEEQGDAAPFGRTPQLVEGHEGEHHEQPDGPAHGVGRLVQDSHTASLSPRGRSRRTRLSSC